MTETQHCTPPPPASISNAQCEALRRAGEHLCARLHGARSLACVEAAFAAFWGDEAMMDARALLGEDRATDAAIRAAVREGLDHLYITGRGWWNCLNKPFGYPGDFGVLEQVYDCSPHPQTREAWACWSEKWGLSQQLPRAVKARKDVLRAWLEGYAGEAEHARVLSVASGGAREIRELAPDLLSRLEITLFDSDPRTHDFVRGGLARYPEPPTSVHYLVGDAVRGRGEGMEQLAGPYDLIYSFGLFDYLPDRLLLRCASHFLPYLAEGGQFIFCLKDARRYDPVVYDLLYDWRFVPRTLEDGPRLARQMGLKIQQTLITEGGVIGVFVCGRK